MSNPIIRSLEEFLLNIYFGRTEVKDRKITLGLDPVAYDAVMEALDQELSKFGLLIKDPNVEEMLNGPHKFSEFKQINGGSIKFIRLDEENNSN